tara:strand:+ start:878 stop:1612 length:735 start_codon:yes stop_codon:yes gene_type:complete
MSSINLKAYNLAKKYPFFKIFFLFYNVYIRNLKFYFKSSQFDEDLKISNLFEKNYKGNFIDLGCFHPTRQNNTFKLYKRGWRGINIDLNALTIDLFNFARPGDINICAAISNSRSKKSLYYVGDFATQNTLQKEHTYFLKKHFKISSKDIQTKKIKTQKLEDILNTQNMFTIDFMNIDIEGHELEVLKSLNLKKYNIKVICVEILNYNKFTKSRKSKLLNFFKKNKYKLVSKSSINYIFKRIEH